MVSVTAIDGGNGSTTMKNLNVKDLTRLAKTGQYKIFRAKYRNGDEEEYIVRRGKLVKV
jgi:hypothetical protein